MAERTIYGLILEEGFGGNAYAYSFTDRELMDWILEPVSFPEGEGLVRVRIPGVEVRASVTIGSSTNDKAIALTGCGKNHYQHPALTEIDPEKLRRLISAEHIYEGLIY